MEHWLTGREASQATARRRANREQARGGSRSAKCTSLVHELTHVPARASNSISFSNRSGWYGSMSLCNIIVN